MTSKYSTTGPGERLGGDDALFLADASLTGDTSSIANSIVRDVQRLFAESAVD